MTSAVGSGGVAGAILGCPALAQSSPPGPPAGSRDGSIARARVKYRFDDADMDYFFVISLGWGATGGLSVGQAFHVASTIADGDAASWVASYSAYGDYCL